MKSREKKFNWIRILARAKADRGIRQGDSHRGVKFGVDYLINQAIIWIAIVLVVLVLRNFL